MTLTRRTFLKAAGAVAMLPIIGGIAGKLVKVRREDAVNLGIDATPVAVDDFSQSAVFRLSDLERLPDA